MGEAFRATLVKPCQTVEIVIQDFEYKQPVISEEKPALYSLNINF